MFTLDDHGYDSDKDTSKTRKSRNLSEKKRRDHFNMLINELHSLVSKSGRKMDKTTVLKATMVYLRNHNEATKLSHLHEISEDWKPAFLSNDEFTQIMLEAVDSLILVMSQSGTIFYASESVSHLLNHAPSDLVNRSFFDLLHPSDQITVKQMLLGKQFTSLSGDNIRDFRRESNQVEFTCHIRCGSLMPEMSSYYEPCKISGFFSKINNGSACENKPEASGSPQALTEDINFCCTARIIATRFIKELSVTSDSQKEFTSRHSMEWKFLFLDHRGPSIIGYLPFELLGTSGYDYYHPDDLTMIAKCHEQLISTGEGMSCIYRFLTKGQQWIWLQTHYYITYHQWTSKPEFIVCTNTLVSYTEVIASLKQRALKKAEETAASAATEKHDGEKGAEVTSTPEVAPSTTLWPENPETESEPPVLPPAPAVAITPPEEVKLEAPSPTQPVRPPSVNSVASTDSLVPPPVVGTQALPVPVNMSTVTLTPRRLVISSVQQTLQTQLQEKHRQLQDSIRRQQAELHSIREQLLLTQRLSVPIDTSELEGVIVSAGPEDPHSPEEPMQRITAGVSSVASPISVGEAELNHQQAAAPILIPVPFYTNQQLMFIQNSPPATCQSPSPSVSSQHSIPYTPNPADATSPMILSNPSPGMLPSNPSPGM